MFVRRKKVDNHDYIQIVHGYRENGKVKQRTVLSLGRADDETTMNKIDSLLYSLQKFSQNSAVLSSKNQDIDSELKIIGPALIFERLWRNLGIGEAITKEAKEFKFEFNVERAVFVSVLHRLLRTGSDLDCSQWMKKYEIKGVEGLELQHLYRAIGFLGRRTGKALRDDPSIIPRVKDKIEESIYTRQLEIFSEFKMVFFDTTSMYFEGAGGKELGKRGYSKDYRPDLNQVVVGALLDERGIPICCEVFPGNTADLKTLIPITESLKNRFGFWNFCIVADRGMISNPTLEHFQQDNSEMSFILGCRMRKEVIVKNYLQSREIDWEQEKSINRAGKERIFYKEVKLKEGQRYIICYTELQARKDAKSREEIIDHLLAKGNEDLKSLIKNAGYKRYLKASGKRLEIDFDKIKSEAAYDGIWVLQTNTNLSAEEVVLRYKDLWQVEYVFRTMKSTLDTRPIFHQLDERIVGHIFCSFLALVLKKELISLLDKNGYVFTWRQIIDDLNSLSYIEVDNGIKKIKIRSNTVGCTSKIFSSVGVAIPESIIML